MTSLVHDDAASCRWCYCEPATTIVYGVPTGIRCAAGEPKDRVNAWLRYVRGDIEKRKARA